MQSGNSDVLLWLLKDHALDASICDSLGRSASHTAASMGSSHALQCLHENKQLSFEPAEDNTTPLHAAARVGSVDCVLLLLAAGHPVAVADSQGSSPLHVAALEQHVVYNCP